MTNAQCLSGEENPCIEDMAVGMVLERVASDLLININTADYVPIYRLMKEWLNSEKK